MLWSQYHITKFHAIYVTIVWFDKLYEVVFSDIWCELLDIVPKAKKLYFI